MRDYKFQADDDSVEVFRRLRGAWRDVQVTERRVTVRLADGSAVQINVQLHDIEPGFAATCIVADSITGDLAHRNIKNAQRLDTSDLGLGGNDVVLFTGATWLSPTSVQSSDERVDVSGLEAIVQQVGMPADVPPDAEAVCMTHDAIVIASPVGTGCLIRIASVAGKLEVITDKAVIAAFLTTRSYGSDAPESSDTATSDTATSDTATSDTATSDTATDDTEADDKPATDR